MHSEPARRRRGFTLIEVLICIAVVAFIVALLIPALAKAKAKSCHVACINNVKQIGLAFRMYSNDHGDQFPWHVSVTNEGSLELATSRDVFRHFLAASNEIYTPKVLVCPKDLKRIRATDWAKFNNSNLSYFVAIDAAETKPDMILSGDRNITGGTLSNGFLLSVTPTSLVSWTKEIHGSWGNVGLADVSAQQCDTAGLRTIVSNTVSPFRLALP